MKKNYRFYVTSDNAVIAVSTYAGKIVRGIAKCAPIDTFSLEDGKALAAARCNLKISEKRRNRAARKLIEARAALDDAMRHAENMKHYFEDSCVALDDAHFEVQAILDKLVP